MEPNDRLVALKEAVWLRDGYSLVVMFDPSVTTRIADADGQVERLLGLLRGGPHRIDDLRRGLAAAGIVLTSAQVDEALQTLDGLGLVENGAQLSLGDPALDERHAGSLAFFSSYASLAEGRSARVARLRSAHVLQLGLGGVGSSVLQCLAGAGVSRLTLVDDDSFELRNLVRQFPYRSADVGRPKVDRAAEWVRCFDPDIDVRAVSRRITAAASLADLLDGVDVVVSSIDEPPEAYLWVNEAAVARRIPMITGGVGPFYVAYSSVDPGRSACHACMSRISAERAGEARGATERELLRRLDRPNGSIGPMATLAGGLVALEAVRYLTGMQPPQAAGARLVMDLRDGLTPRCTEFHRLADCVVCGELARTTAGLP